MITPGAASLMTSRGALLGFRFLAFSKDRSLGLASSCEPESWRIVRNSCMAIHLQYTALDSTYTPVSADCHHRQNALKTRAHPVAASKSLW